MSEINTQTIIDCVKKIIKEMDGKIMVEASGRHVHLSEKDAIALFGTKTLNKLKDLSQPGQYVSDKKVTLVGSKSVLENVTVLGPCREKTQVELSMTDAKKIGVPPVVRESGDLNDTPGIVICSDSCAVKVENSVIVAQRHIHMTPDDAKMLDVSDREIVKVKINGKRALIFDDVIVRVNTNYRLSMHIDYDEANAVGFDNTSYGIILR